MAFVNAPRALNARRSDHSDEDAFTVRRHPAVVDADCYRVTRARAGCVSSARFSGSSSTYWRKVRRSLWPMFSSAALGVQAVADRLREPFGVGVTQPVRGRAFKPVGIDEPAVGAG